MKCPDCLYQINNCNEIITNVSNPPKSVKARFLNSSINPLLRFSKLPDKKGSDKTINALNGRMIIIKPRVIKAGRMYLDSLVEKTDFEKYRNAEIIAKL